MTKDELIAALEKATGPSRELDVRIEILCVQGRTDFLPTQKDADAIDDIGGFLPRYTASIDTALTLVDQDWSIEIYRSRAERGAKKCVASVGTYDCDQGHLATGKATTPAIALCIAALRARP